MINPSLGRSLTKNGKRTSLDSRRRDLNHPSTKMQKGVLNPVIPLKVCTSKTFPLKVGTDQQNKQRKRKIRRKDLSNVGLVENHTYLETAPICSMTTGESTTSRR
jgi:ABC-type antimicrobial peptide transport system ATPase subunit